jgi:hypothetical protein
MKAVVSAPSLRILVCAAMAVIITAVSTQTILQLASEPRQATASAGEFMLAQDDSRAGSITVAMAR